MDDKPAPLFSVKGLDAHLLTEASAPDLQNLFNRCSDYFKLVEGRTARKNAAIKEFTDTPPGFDNKNLLCIGLRRSNGALAGVILTLRHYPRENNWYLSLFLLDPAWRGLHIGQICYFAFEDWVRGQNGQTLLLAVVSPNQRGAKFWEAVGFRLPRCYPPKRFGLKRHVLIEFEKALDRPWP